ncbi:MAG: tetratricopeptide repeat protein [Bdellovibrionota bacterium]
MHSKLTPTFSLLGLAILFWSAAAGLSSQLGAPKGAAGGSSHGGKAAAVALSDDLKALKADADAHPDRTDARLNFANAAREEAIQKTDNGLLMEAVQAYTAVLAKEPNQTQALLGLASLCFEAGIMDKAQEYYRRYLQLKPDDLRVKTDYALSQIQTDALDDALVTLNEVINKDHSIFQAHLAVALVYKLQGKTDEAKAKADEAKRLAPSDADRARIDEFLTSLTAKAAAGQQRAELPPSAIPGTPGGEEGEGSIAPEDLSPAGMVSQFFASHPIVGPKLKGIAWPELNTAIVRLENFPVDQMPPFAREKFLGSMKQKLSGLPNKVTVKLVDADSGAELLTVEAGGEKPAS